MKYCFATALMLFAITCSTHAQNARLRQYTVPLAGTTVLSETDDKYNAQVFNLEAPEPDGAADQQRLAEIKQQMGKLYPRHNSIHPAAKTTSVPQPTIAISFVADSLAGVPPDNYMAINKNDSAVAVMNSTIAIHNALTGQMTFRKNIQLFSSSVSLNGTNDYRFDPKVIYDPEADRFICIMLNSVNTLTGAGVQDHNWIVVGFSQTSSPSGTWKFYKFFGDFANDTTFFDYPCIAFTHNELFITGNKVRDNISWQTGFKESVIYQVRKQDGYNGNVTLNYQLWDSITYNGGYIRNLYPVKGSGSIGGPSQYFLGNRILDAQNDTVFMVKIPDTIGSSSNNLVVNALVSNIPYGVPPNGLEPDTSVQLMTNDGRILGGYFQNNDIQFVSTSVDTNNGAAGIYHGTISNYASSPVLTAHIFSIDSLDFGYPNISYAGTQGSGNQSIISFDYTGHHTYPAYGALFYDGTNYSSMLTVKGGDSSIKVVVGQAQRWGDYSGSQPDWNAIGCVWVDGIYGRKDHNYGNYMAKLNSPYFTGISNIPSSQNNSLLYPNPSWQFVKFEFSLDKEQVVNFVIYNSQGQVVDKLLSQNCKDGRNRIQFNVGSLATGTYFLKAFGDKGNIISTNTFIRQ